MTVPIVVTEIVDARLKSLYRSLFTLNFTLFINTARDLHTCRHTPTHDPRSSLSSHRSPDRKKPPSSIDAMTFPADDVVSNDTALTTNINPTNGTELHAAAGSGGGGLLLMSSAAKPGLGVDSDPESKSRLLRRSVIAASLAVLAGSVVSTGFSNTV